MTRIIAGEYGGRRIQVPRGNSTRPTADRVREAVFASVESMLTSSQNDGLMCGTGWRGVRVLDLFSGSGALSLEAASRGAVSVDAVDNSPRAAQAISMNIKSLGLTSVRFHRRSVSSFLEHTQGPHQRQAQPRERHSTALPEEVDVASRRRAPTPTPGWDVVFMDPPYELGHARLETLLHQLRPWLAPGAVVAIERASKSEFVWPPGYAPRKDKTYGTTRLWYGH